MRGEKLDRYYNKSVIFNQSLLCPAHFQIQILFGSKNKSQTDGRLKYHLFLQIRLIGEIMTL